MGARTLRSTSFCDLEILAQCTLAHESLLWQVSDCACGAGRIDYGVRAYASLSNALNQQGMILLLVFDSRNRPGPRVQIPGAYL